MLHLPLSGEKFDAYLKGKVVKINHQFDVSFPSPDKNI